MGEYLGTSGKAARVDRLWDDTYDRRCGPSLPALPVSSSPSWVLMMVLYGEAILLVRGGPNEGSSLLLSEGMIMIGRAPLNDIVLEEPGVSRQHADIRGDSEGYWLADLRSRNGTFVNGERIGVVPHRLSNFDRIEMGGTATRVHWIFMESQATIDIPLPTQK